MDLFVEPLLSDWLVLCALLFSIGLYGFFTRTSIVGMLMALEIMLNSVAIMFISFDRFSTSKIFEGEIMSLFIIALAACEVVILMAILMVMFRKKGPITTDKLEELKG